eukprot:gene14745-5624_t
MTTRGMSYTSSSCDDLDPRRGGAVTADDWTAAFDRLRIELDGGTRELHGKAGRASA